MNELENGGYKHMSLADRFIIEAGLNRGISFKQIADTVHRASSTIARAVKNYRVFLDAASLVLNDCVSRATCKATNLCGEACQGRCAYCRKYDCRSVCNKYKSAKCPALDNAPYVCNACQKRQSCKMLHAYYTSQRANAGYTATLSEARSGIRSTPEKLHEIDELLKPLLKRGQSLNHIFATHADEIGCSRKTVYNYIEGRALSTKNIDLPRKVRYRRRKKPKPAFKIEYSYRLARTYKDFQIYMEKNPTIPVVEMDTVKGKREKGKVLLTMIFRESNFMLIFIMPDGTKKSVLKVFDDLTALLGLDTFRKLFPVILTDNGVEFKDAPALEYTKRNDQRTRVFYCDPQVAWQKPHVEKNHQFIRNIMPKSTSFDALTQEDTILMTNHINSFARDSLNGKTPFDEAEKETAGGSWTRSRCTRRRPFKTSTSEAVN
jgi:transposase, IS30 family